MSKLKMIFATGPCGEFGNGNTLPWDLPEDLTNFKEYTKDDVLIMSGATFESLPGKLPGRVHCVISDRSVEAKNGMPPDYTFSRENGISIITDVLREEHPGKDLTIIGGRVLLEELAGIVDEAMISTIDKDRIGDCDKHIDNYYILHMFEDRLEIEFLHIKDGFTLTKWSKKSAE